MVMLLANFDIFPGNNVTIPGEVVVLNAIVLPHKELGSSSKNQIIL